MGEFPGGGAGRRPGMDSSPCAAAVDAGRRLGRHRRVPEGSADLSLPRAGGVPVGRWDVRAAGMTRPSRRPSIPFLSSPDNPSGLEVTAPDIGTVSLRPRSRRASRTSWRRVPERAWTVALEGLSLPARPCPTAHNRANDDCRRSAPTPLRRTARSRSSWDERHVDMAMGVTCRFGNVGRGRREGLARRASLRLVFGETECALQEAIATAPSVPRVVFTRRRADGLPSAASMSEQDRLDSAQFIDASFPRSGMQGRE